MGALERERECLLARRLLVNPELADVPWSLWVYQSSTGRSFSPPVWIPCSRKLYDNFELIISDNASSDETAAICESYAKRDSRIRYERLKSNRGAAWNHNHVLERARGVYFRWCGADDCIAPRFLEACVEALENRADAVLAYPLSVVIDGTDQPVDRTSDRMELDAADPVIRFAHLLESWNSTHNPFYGVMRMTSLAGVRHLGTFLANDRALLAEMALRGPFVRVEEYLMLRRRHTGNIERTRENEARLMDPGAKGYWSREWRMLHEHLVSVFGANVTLSTRLRLMGAVASWVGRIRGTLLWEARESFAIFIRRIWRELQSCERGPVDHGVGR